MILSNTSSFPYHAPALSTYTAKRKEIITLIRSINTKLDFNSQTFFLAVYYMDEIFTSTHFPVEPPDMSNYILLSLCCLIISSKFNENDPKVPDIYKYINICTETTKYKYLFSIDDIRNGEVFILQQLQYKLNYFSVYHYIVFFFAHGVIFKRTYERSEVKHVNASGNGVTKKKLLERIYIHSREILDYYLEDDNEFWYCNCKYNYLIAVVILWKVTEHVLKVSLSDSENVYKMIYAINVEECEVYRDICCKVERIYEGKVLKRKKGITSGNGVNTNVNVNSPKELNHSEIKTPTSSNKNTNRYSYVQQQQQQNYFMSGISRLRLGEDSSMKVKAMTKGQQKKQNSNSNSGNNNNMQIQSNMSLSTSGFDKIKNDFTGNKIDLLKIHMKKRACSTNKETSRFINNTNNININDLPIQSINNNNNNNTMNTNLNNSRIDHTNTNNIIISQQTSPLSIHPTNSTIKSNEILYHKYIGITKPPLSKTDDYTPATTTSSHTNNNININTTYTSNNRQLYPNNILDKTKKIFDQAKSIKTPYNTIINTQQTGLTYNNNNNNNHLRNIPRASNVDSNYSSGNDLYGNNTIIINNNININAYIDKNSNSSSNDNHYYYNNYESYNSYNKGRRDDRYNVHSVSNFNSAMNGSVNSSNSHQQGKFGKFGTYYDYGYGYSGYKGGKGGKYMGYEYY